MTIHLTLTTTADGHLLAHTGDPAQPLAPPTPLADLPRIVGEQNPFARNPIDPGQRLWAAMGGQALADLLANDPDNRLLLITAGQTAGLPWEQAVLPDGTPLVWQHGLLRLLPNAPPPRAAPVGASGPLNLAVLAADPLVDAQGRPILAHRRFGPAPQPGETSPRLDLQAELDAIRDTLAASGRQVLAQRLPPTLKHLRPALRRGPALLHLSCHGSVIELANGRQQAVLALEDEYGQQQPLNGDELKRLPPPGVLRLVVMSACRTASGGDANLARALVLAGATPAAVGMQGDFPDPSGAAFAANLYDSLLLGYDLAESLRQARASLPAGYAGLPVAYVTNGGGQPLPVAEGRPNLAALQAGRNASLPSALTPPTPFVGREQELHGLARALATNPVVTVVGTGGMGKTALAAAYAHRFGWRWPGGVLGYSLAEQPTLSPETVLLSLLARLLGDEAARALAEQPAERLFETLLAEVQTRRPLLIIDNYETVLQLLVPAQTDDEEEGAAAAAEAPDPAAAAGAERLHRLLARLVDGGANLLLTSRRQPAGLPHEVTFPPGRSPALPGLTEAAGAELFLRHSSRAKADAPAHQTLAGQVARLTNGHPQAISLLAGEFDVSAERSAADFLAHWDEELAAARRPGMAEHHVTFAAAFARSAAALPARLRARLQALARFEAPFFAEGAALLWGHPPDDEAELAAVRADLGALSRRSLLAVDIWYEDDTPATYRLEPVIQRHLARRAAGAAHPPPLAEPEAAYAAYAAWLARRCYGDIHRSPALARLAFQWLDELLAQTEAQPPAELPGYGRRLAWLLRHYGRLVEAGPLLARAEALARQQQDEAMLSSILYEQADVAVIRGDLDRALQLYQDSLAIKEKIGDLQGKAASLHQMAQVYLTRGDLDRALQLYQDSLATSEKLGDLQGKGASLHQMAQVYLTRGDLDRALQLYHDSLAIKEKIGDLQGKAASLHQMAQVYLTRGDLDRALQLYQDSLATSEKLGDLQGKAASLHQMAQVYLTRGDLDRALQLYQDSLAIKEKIGDLQGKAASLHQMAQVYLTRGDLDRALQLYQDSLATSEKLGDLQGKGASLHQMAQVYLTRGDLDRALQLYQDSLAIKEKIGDLQGKAASLSNMAQVYLTRGDLDRALQLYQDSLAIKEKIGDLQGKAASLSNMAQVYLTRGDLDRALQLYQDSLAILEKIGDLQGKAASLSNMANVYMAQENWDEAEKLVQEALEIAKQLNAPEDVAFTTVKLGQVAQARGQEDEARRRYREGLAIFERLGMPEASQVRQMLAGLEGGARPQPSRAEAIAALRQEASPEAQQQLSILLYNEAGALAQQGRLAEAVAAMEEVVAIDEVLGLDDLASDRAVLEQFRQQAAGQPPSAPAPSPATSDVAQLRAQLQAQIGDALAQAPPPQEQAQLRQLQADLAQLSDDELLAWLQQQSRAQIEAQAEQVVQTAVQAHRAGQTAALLPQLEQAAARWAEGEESGSPAANLAQFTRAAIALLQGRPPEPVAPEYAARLAQLRQALAQGRDE